MTIQKFYKKLGRRTADFRDANLMHLLINKLKFNSVLDIGCGNGYYMSVLKTSGFKVQGIEPDQNLIKESEEIFGKLNIKQGFAEDLPKHFNRKFDNVILIDVLEHIENDALVLRNSHNILKTGGRIIILVPAYRWLFSRRDIMWKHFRRYEMQDLKLKIIDAGFTLIESRYWNAILLPMYILYTKLPCNMEQKYARMRGERNIINKTLRWWFKNIENRINFGFGVNILCVGVKT